MANDAHAAGSWDALEGWPDASLGDQVSEGSVNDVRRVQIGDRRCVARLSRSGGETLDWEVRLLSKLTVAGIGVPQVVPTATGAWHQGGLIVMDFVDGRLPESEGDRKAVLETIMRVHTLTAAWDRQRPGWRSVAELVTENRSGPVDMASLPSEVAERCRAAWRPLRDRRRCVIHGDPNPTNVRITDRGVVLLDWDEARVDVPLLDLVGVHGHVVRDEGERRVGERAAHAWEAALFWHRSPAYAQKRLDQVDTC